jgi:16S rRNA (guanine1207-N2)-methyltransferase
MRDLALAWIIQQITSAPASSHKLWCTDENSLDHLPSADQHNELTVITNRWDIYLEAKAQKFNVEFSDFDLSKIADHSLDRIFYRVSKEKPIVHHLLNEAWRCLKVDGQLVLAGHKNEGVKTYIEKAAGLLGAPKKIQKSGNVYSAELQKHATYNPSLQLTASDYTLVRPLEASAQLLAPIFYTKPGLFGWNKIDQGSAFLIAQLPQILTAHSAPIASALDLGCGYGYLSLMAAQLPALTAITQWTMTDNNAAAIQIAQHNSQVNHINADVIAADAADSIKLKADLILCNPPFHQGFNQSGELTDKFIAATHRLLSDTGIAVFVINQFIPLERKAGALFKGVSTIADNGSFKVICLSHH